MSQTISFNIRGNPYLNSIAECVNKGAYNLMDLEKRTARYYFILYFPYIYYKLFSAIANWPCVSVITNLF